jgi:formate hydrogenlyase subunit 4
MNILTIFINIIIFLLLAPLYEGIVRKITAKLQSRQGPPVIQPYYDILKLLGKQNLVSNNAGFKMAPIIAISSIITVIAMVPLGYQANALTKYADVISIIYLLTLGGAAILLGALSSKNTYAAIGASREMITMIMVEPVLAMTFIMGAVKVRSLCIDSTMFTILQNGYGVSAVLMLAVFVMALQAFVAKQPFDIAEAEVEIMEGPFIEYSGPNYGLFKYYMMMKQMFYAALFVTVFVPFLHTGSYIVNIAAQLAEILVVFIFITIIGATNPRYRIDQAIKYYAVLIVLSLCAVGLSAYGI